MKKSKSINKAQKLVSDFDLWVKVSKSVKPADPNFAQELENLQLNEKPAGPVPAATRIFLPQSSPAPKTPKQNSRLSLTGLDRSQQKRLLRGQVEPDARLDLHGESLETARLKLRRFLSLCYEQNLRTVLVITGKGSDSFTQHTLHSRNFEPGANRTGRLRTAVPEWLNEFEFRTLVTGFQPSHPKHGGGGAFYIRLRNKNRGKNRR